MAYWLFKSEPSCYAFADLLASPDQTTGWDGVRNFQARNFLRDEIKAGDGVLFYHSSADPPAIAGIAEVVRAGHPDPTAFDPKADHYDPKSDPADPTWYQVAIRAVRAIDPPLGLPLLRTVSALAGMELLRKGSRLSIQPVERGRVGRRYSRWPRRSESARREEDAPGGSGHGPLARSVDPGGAYALPAAAWVVVARAVVPPVIRAPTRAGACRS